MGVWARIFGRRKNPLPAAPSDQQRPPQPPAATEAPSQSASSLDQRLLLAVEACSLPEVKSLVASGANVNATKRQEVMNHKTFSMTVYARPAIHLALDALDLFGGSDEQKAAVQPVLQTLLAGGAHIDAQDGRNYNWTPLMRAAYLNHPKLVQYLLDNGANAKLKDANGRTVFGLIRSENNWKYNVVQEILVAATEDGRAYLQSSDGQTWRRVTEVDENAPIPAVRGEVTDLLRDALRATDSEQLRRIVRWVEAGGDLDWRSPNGWTLLHLAAQGGNAKMVRFLLDYGADINALDNEGGTPLMLACDVGFMARLSASTVTLLLDRGADPNAVNRHGSTALRLVRQSVSEQAKKIAQLLIDRGSVPTPGKDSPCQECGAPYSADMARRGVVVTFTGALATFACLSCNAPQQVDLGQIDRSKGLQVLCACGAIVLIPASVWCGICGKGLSTDWQKRVQKVR